jgi:DNA-binding transcriptional LysR family regulator
MGIYAWEFEKGGRELKVRVEGQFVFNNIALRLNAVLAGFGLAYLPEDQVRTSRADSSSACLRTGVHLFRATTSITPAAAIPHLLSPLVDALRYKGGIGRGRSLK